MAASYAYEHEFDYLNSNAAPVLEPQRQPKQQHNLKKLKKHRPRKRELESHVKIAKIFVLMSLAVALAGAFCNSLVARNESRVALQAAQKELAMYSDENIVLKDRLSKLVSAENIDRIATQKLGLVKIVAANETYLDSQKDNEVLFSQGK